MIGGQRKRPSAKERGVNLVGYLNHVLGAGRIGAPVRRGKRTGCPVAWRPAVAVGNPAYPVDATWAEPDLDQAAALMRRVARAPWWAALRGRRAARRMRRRHSALAVGRRIERELKHGASSSDDRKSLSPGRSAC